jgi:hypothetical protein
LFTNDAERRGLPLKANRGAEALKLFSCESCGQLLYFENVRCERCSHLLGYLPAAAALSALEPDGDSWRALHCPDGLWRFCANAENEACNWLVPLDSADRYCRACRHNRTVPDLTVPDHVAAWRKLELAKHRLFYSLLRFRLPVTTKSMAPDRGLAFDFLADPPTAGDQARVMTVHDNGVITIAVTEADDVERERRRVAMGEPYRTLLGHFRHEIGHYFWDRLVADRGLVDACRARFGDETADYGAALQKHYREGAPADWQTDYVSAYASSHPWEDFAETWAHYLHIVDTLEMAAAFGLHGRPRAADGETLAVAVDVDPYRADDIRRLVDNWLPLTNALNNLNRCMGAADPYPFILSPVVIGKLGFIHRLVRSAKSGAPTDFPEGPSPSSSLV